MAKRNIEVIPLFKYSFHQFKQYTSFTIGIMSTYFVLAIIPQVYIMLSTPEEPTTKLQIFSTLLIVVQTFMTLGFIKIMLRLVDDQYAEVKDLFNSFRPFLSYFAAYFIYIIAVAIGLMLFVIPGIYIAIRFMFYPYYLLTGTSTSFLALRQSFELTRGLEWDIFRFGFTALALNIIGSFLFGIGLIITYPLTTMATAALFQSLQSSSDVLPTREYRP